MKLKKNIKLLVSADGGAASGKTTGARMISKKYGLKLLTSGLLYRYVSYKLIANKKLAKDIGENGQKLIIKHFSKKSVIAKWQKTIY